MENLKFPPYNLSDTMRIPLLFLALPLTAFAKPGEVDFATQIQPILSDNCYACHGPDESKAEGGLRLDQQELAFTGGESGKAIIPGDPANSLLIQRISVSHDDDDLMPPLKKKEPLKPAQIALLSQWITEGAKWGEHWAFLPPTRPEVPAVKDPSWVKTPVDNFILATLEEEKLSPSPPADSRTLLRRRSLDLIGLPPTLEELKNPEAVTVDALLANRSTSPATLTPPATKKTFLARCISIAIGSSRLSTKTWATTISSSNKSPAISSRIPPRTTTSPPVTSAIP